MYDIYDAEDPSDTSPRACVSLRARPAGSLQLTEGGEGFGRHLEG